MREAAGVFLAFAALGIVTSAPGVTTGDAGELAAASAVLGVAHAPGYPLYALAGKAFGLLVPFAAWTHRMNVFSAVLGAAALALLGAALRRWGFSLPSRLGAVALLGLAPVWREASAVTEVFALHAFLACLLLWLVSSERVLDDGPSAALGLAFGLALGNHQTILLVLPALLLAGRARPRSVVFAVLGALAGFSVYAFLPVRAAASPPLDWGHAVTPSAFWRVLTRQDYGSFSLTTDGEASLGLPGMARQIWRGVVMLGPAAAVLAAAGALVWPAQSRLSRRAALAWPLIAGPGFLLLGMPGFDAQTEGALARFSLLPLIGAVVLAAGALESLRARAAAAAVAVALLAPLAGASTRSWRHDYLTHDYGRTLFDALPPDALFVMDGGDDTFYSLAALRWAHGLRPDVELRDRGGIVFPGLYGPDFRKLPRAEKESRRLAVESAAAASGRLWYSTLNPSLLPGGPLVAGGLLRRPAPLDAAALDAAVAVRRAPPHDYRGRALAAFIPYSRGVSALDAGRLSEAVSWLEQSIEDGPDVLWVPPAVSYALGVAGWRAMGLKDAPLAVRAYRSWAALVPSQAEPATNLGAALEALGRREEAEAAYRDAMRREPGAARPWASLGALEWGRGRFAESAAAFDEAAAREPGQPSHASWAASARRRLARR